MRYTETILGTISVIACIGVSLQYCLSYAYGKFENITAMIDVFNNMLNRPMCDTTQVGTNVIFTFLSVTN